MKIHQWVPAAHRGDAIGDSARTVRDMLRGMGHDLSVSNLYGGLEVSPWSKRFAGLLEDFIKLSPNVAKFRADNSVRANLAKLKASDRTRDPNLASRCGKS